MSTLESMCDAHFERVGVSYAAPHRCQFCGRRYRTEDGYPIVYDGYTVCGRCKYQIMEEEEESA